MLLILKGIVFHLIHVHSFIKFFLENVLHFFCDIFLKLFAASFVFPVEFCNITFAVAFDAAS